MTADSLVCLFGLGLEDALEALGAATATSQLALSCALLLVDVGDSAGGVGRAEVTVSEASSLLTTDENAVGAYIIEVSVLLSSLIYLMKLNKQINIKINKNKQIR